MERWRGKIAVVTGASAGIGLAIARTLLKKGMIVVGIARREEKMKEGVKDLREKNHFHAIRCDVSKEHEVIETFQWIRKKFGMVNVLVNNAGVLKVPIAIADMEADDMRQIFDTNVMGLLYCSQQAIKLMKTIPELEAHIINMSSIVGQINMVPQSVPINVYAATKHAVTGLSETLRAELLGGKIKVTNVSPGYVKTRVEEPVTTDEESSTKTKHPMLEMDDVAEAIAYIISTPAHVQITEFTIRALGERNFQ